MKKRTGLGRDPLAALTHVADKVHDAGWEIVYTREPRPDQRRLMERMGVAVVVDTEAAPGVRRAGYPRLVPPRTQGGHA